MSTDALTVARAMAADDRPDVDALLVDPATAFGVRVLRAAQRVVTATGLHASMDDIAAEAGVGRRSLFRHFGSRDNLVAQAVTLALDAYGREVARTTTTVVDDRPPGDWLEDLISKSHRAHLDAGVGLWQLAAADDADLPGPLAEVNRRRRAARAEWTRSVAEALWSRSGHRGDAPQAVVDGVGLAVSSFATRSMIEDLGRDVAGTTRSTVAMLLALVAAEGSASSAPG